MTPSGYLERLGPHDDRLGLRIIDIKISGQPSPAHFAELAYYGMALAGWLEDTRRTDQFVVLADAAIWPGAHDGSTIHHLLREDRAAGIPVLDLQRYLTGLDADLEAMPPEVVLGRIQRFLRVDLRDVLAEPDWRSLTWHIDSRCSGCDYLGYRWSRHDDEAAEGRPPQGPAPDERYCWPMAERTQHLSRVAGLTEGACGKLREVRVLDVAAVSALPAGSLAFEQHQMLRAKRTVISARATTLRNITPAAIPDRAGSSAVLPRFADIRVSLSADFDVVYTSCLNYGYREKGHRANGFSADGGFAEYAVNNINTMVHVPDDMSDEEATLIVTSGTAMYGLDVMGGIIAGEAVVITGPGPIGLMGVGVAKALGAQPLILTGTRQRRLEMGKRLGADEVVNVNIEDPVEAVQRITRGTGVQYVLECSGAPNALNEAARMVNRGGRICLAAFPADPVPVDLAYLVRNNIYVFGIRGEGKSATHRAAALMAQKRFDAKMIHTHTFPLAEVPTAIKYARERIEDAIKVVIKIREN